jgi:hypothetical protein
VGMSRRPLLPLVLLACLAAAPAAHAAPEVLARELLPFTADEHAGWIAWSSYDRAGGAFRLRLRRPDGAVVDAPVAPRGLAFDVDLGPGPDGGPTAVYSRCARQGRPVLRPPVGEQTGKTPRGCDLYLLDLAGGRERRIASASSPRHDERLPSIDGDRVAFLRRSGPRDLIYVGNVAGRPGSRRQPAGPQTRFSGVEALEYAGGRLVYVWADTIGTSFQRQTLRRVSRGRSVPLYVTRSGGANASDLVGLSYARGRLYFGETNNGSGTGNRLYRITLGGRELSAVRGSSDYLSAVWDGQRFVTASGYGECFGRVDAPPESSTCTLERTDPPAWAQARASSPAASSLPRR